MSESPRSRWCHSGGRAAASFRTTYRIAKRGRRQWDQSCHFFVTGCEHRSHRADAWATSSRVSYVFVRILKRAGSEKSCFGFIGRQGRVCPAVVTGQCEMADELFGRSEHQLKRPALAARDRARVWFVLRSDNCDDSHLVEALK